ncbi:spore coat protein SA [Tumebacillus sp. BK434]|uniref:glycosyltransferase family 4 protein n=1 Tax=Tumebacillus sp. BK434 TaxID=2512169 RepID=UPI00104BB1E2|nr:glycosyltransferase family 4 protein [Tumebacillus sp. BK434]TCP52437.1 spore coat protein SA [Tumebacillus sp. BK434]
MTICCIAPGTFPFPPAPCTSVEIYLWHLARELSRTEPLLLYGKTDAVRADTPVSYLRHVLREVKQHSSPPALFHVENRIPFVVPIKKRFAQTPLVLNLHSNVLIQDLSPLTLRMSLSRLDALVVNSRYLQGDLLARYPVLPKEKVHVIQPGIDLTQFPSRFSPTGAALRAKVRARHQIADDQQIVLTAGRFTPRKGIAELLDAFRLVHTAQPQSVLWIIGGRPRDERHPFHTLLREKAAGLPVRFFGFLPHDRLPAYYAAADLFVCPSQQPEAFGLVNLEASAAALPVVATGRWGLCESVAQDVSGRLVEAFADPAAFAWEIGRLLDDPQGAAQLGVSGRNWVERRFSWERTARQFRALYARVRT